jgi:L-alanine-DL-glutamate epimerase-like enolase superfamily enzyme
VRPAEISDNGYFLQGFEFPSQNRTEPWCPCGTLRIREIAVKIESVDFFYLSMPEVTTEGDGSQDALLVRVSASGYVGWGVCEASPLVSIAAFVCPMSHGACRPVADSVLDQTLDSPADIARIARQVQFYSMDLLQAVHTWSGVEMALWDVLGKARSAPVWSLLGYKQSWPKLPYASQLFGDTPADTFCRAQQARQRGFEAVKFGWGPIGKGDLKTDIDHFQAAREGLGVDAILLVDAGQIFDEDVEAAAARLPALDDVGAQWLEEPFHTSALHSYASLAERGQRVKLAAGEGAHNFHMAAHLIHFGHVGYIQVDCGRIGGIGPAKRVADCAAARGVTFVNHTFTSHLALSASLQPYAGLREHVLCEFPFASKALARELTVNRLERNAAGFLALPDTPGLGVEIDSVRVRKYLVDTQISVKGAPLFSTTDRF